MKSVRSPSLVLAVKISEKVSESYIVNSCNIIIIMLNPSRDTRPARILSNPGSPSKESQSQVQHKGSQQMVLASAQQTLTRSRGTSRVRAVALANMASFIRTDVVPELVVRNATTAILDYNLKKGKAVQQKLQAALRDNMYMVENTGSCKVKIMMQAGVFEVFRRAACAYYDQFSITGLELQTERYVDQGKCLAFTNYKVKHTLTSSQPAYTLTVYTTTSTIIVAGRSHQKFTDDDWPAIADIMGEMNEVRKDTDPVTLNEAIKTCLL